MRILISRRDGYANRMGHMVHILYNLCDSYNIENWYHKINCVVNVSIYMSALNCNTYLFTLLIMFYLPGTYVDVQLWPNVSTKYVYLHLQLWMHRNMRYIYILLGTLSTVMDYNGDE